MKRSIKAFAKTIKTLCEIPERLEELKKDLADLRGAISDMGNTLHSLAQAANGTDRGVMEEVFVPAEAVQEPEEGFSENSEKESAPQGVSEAERSAEESKPEEEEPGGSVENSMEEELEALRAVKTEFGSDFEAHYALYRDYVGGAWKKEAAFYAIHADNYEAFLAQCANPANMTHIYHSLREPLYHRIAKDGLVDMANRLLDCCVQLCAWSCQTQFKRQSVEKGAEYDESRHDRCNNGGERVSRVSLAGITDERNNIYDDCRAYVELE